MTCRGNYVEGIKFLYQSVKDVSRVGPGDVSVHVMHSLGCRGPSGLDSDLKPRTQEEGGNSSSIICISLYVFGSPCGISKYYCDVTQ